MESDTYGYFCTGLGKSVKFTGVHPGVLQYTPVGVSETGCNIDNILRFSANGKQNGF